MNIIESKIMDRQFTKLISKSLKAGCLTEHVISHDIVGIPQGSIISPILCNIFLHQLDTFVENLRIEFDRGIQARNLKKYENARYNIKKAKRLNDFTKLKYLYKKSQKYPVMDFYDPFYRRLIYVRYANDWILGVRGTYKETQTLFQKIKTFCKYSLQLNINESKSLITNLNKNKVVFLGVNIFRSKHVKKSTKSSASKQRQNLQLLMHVSFDRIKKKLSDASMLSQNKPVPKFI